MRRTLLLLAALASSVAPAAAQVRIGIRGGLIGASALLHDSIGERISVRQAPAPNLGFVLENDLDARWRVALGFSTSWGRLSRRAADSSEKIVQLTVWSPTVSLVRVFPGSVTARASIGAVAYDPDHTGGNLFSGGAPILPVVGLGIGTERTAGSGTRILIELGYDVHRFTTGALRDAGFSGAQTVHRISLTFTLSRIAIS